MNPEFMLGMEKLSSQSRPAEKDSPALDPDAIFSLISQILAANELLQHRLTAAEADLRERAEQAASYLTQARTDALTGLPNRRVFNEELARCLAAWRGFGAAFAVVLVDVDRFKGLNDQFGHLAGDAVLADVARALRTAVRAGDLAARFGGEEFAILLPSSDPLGAQQAVERVRTTIEETQFFFDGAFISVTVSCGATHALSEDVAESLLKRCDAALYASKREGRNQSHWHDGERILRLIDAAELDLATPDSGLKLSILDQACQDLRRRLLEVMWLEREAGVPH